MAFPELAKLWLNGIRLQTAAQFALAVFFRAPGRAHPLGVDESFLCTRQEEARISRLLGFNIFPASLVPQKELLPRPDQTRIRALLKSLKLPTGVLTDPNEKTKVIKAAMANLLEKLASCFSGPLDKRVSVANGKIIWSDPPTDQFMTLQEPFVSSLSRAISSAVE